VSIRLVCIEIFGGKVEHQIFMIGGFLFFVAKLNLDLNLDSIRENTLAQLFLEILAAAKLNEVNFANLRIYGLVTDLFVFSFYSYDSHTKAFAFDERLDVNITRDIAFTDMVPVCNKIFGLILTAYIDALNASTLKEVSSPGSMRTMHNKESWEVALQLAQDCCNKFNESVKSVDEIEQNSTAALKLLAKSVQSIPRALYFTGSNDPSSSEEMRQLAHRMVNKKYDDMLKKNILSLPSQ